MKHLIALFLACLVAFSGWSQALHVVLLDGYGICSWGASTAPGPVTYALFYGPESGSYNQTIYAGTNQSCLVTGLIHDSTYYFAVQTSNEYLDGAFSDEAVYVVPRVLQMDFPTTDPFLFSSTDLVTWEASPEAWITPTGWRVIVNESLPAEFFRTLNAN